MKRVETHYIDDVFDSTSEEQILLLHLNSTY